MRLIAYTRVSSEEQRSNSSLEHQYQRICQFAAVNHEVVDHFTDVLTASGKRRRPGFEKALKMIYSGEADGIVCFKLDRFARNALEGLTTIHELSKRGKCFLIVDLQLDTSSPMGAFMLTVLLAFAQLEREIISERTQSGRRSRVEKGLYAHGHPPYGWIASGKRLVKCPLEQTVRSYIFRSAARGESSERIASTLNHWRIPSKRGGKWSGTVIRDILRRPLKLASLLEDSNHDQAS